MAEIKKLPRFFGSRQQILEKHAEYGEEFEQECTDLVGAGVDVDELERHVASIDM